MNTGTACVGSLVETAAYQVYHIIFQDTFGSDHHCQVAAKDEAEVLNKIDNKDNRIRSFLSKKKADHSSVKVMTEEEFKAAFKSALRPFYIIFQNGTRRFCCILSTDPLEAETEFKKRFTEIHGFAVFEYSDFNNLRGGRWKEIPLNPINPN